MSDEPTPPPSPEAPAGAEQGRSPRDSRPTDPVMERLAENTAGAYRIERELGRGGMATVYLAHDLALDRKVAIKVMGQDLYAAGDVLIDRFLREARTGARLNHPHIIPVYAIRESRDLIYFVMKFIDGKPLDDIIHTSGPLPIPLVARVIAQVADALAYAHRNGIVHRDIKPANLMLDKEGWVVLTDLGIAKVQEASMLTATGSAVGTPTYMSPEQSGGSKATTGASDQYSLGCVAFEMLTGRPPFEADSVIALIFQHHADPPPPLQNLRPDCPPEIVAAVARMLQKAPEDRFPSMEEVAQLFRNVSVGDEEEFRLLLGAYATGADAGEAVKRIKTPRTPAPRPSVPVRSPSKPGSREIALSTTGLKPVPRDPTPTSLPAFPPPTAGGVAATQTAWPRTLLRPPEQQARSARRFRVPGVFTILIVTSLTWFLYFPRIGWLETKLPEVTELMATRQKEAEAAVRRGTARGGENSCEGIRSALPDCRKYAPVPMAEIAQVMAEAATLGVDPRFSDRPGNDWATMRRAAGYPRDAFEWGNGVDRSDLLTVMPGLLERMETVGRAGSLTQRVAQIIWFPPDDGLFRKLREVRVSRRMAKALPKERILEVYLNTAEFGPGIYGVEAAAQEYFRIPASRLSRAQAATLAATLATPHTSTPTIEPADMRRRQALILRRLNGEDVSIPPASEFPPGPPTPTP